MSQVLQDFTVFDFELTDFEIIQELSSCASRNVYSATHRDDKKPVRLTVFSTEMSQRTEFRRALKTDRAMLAMLQHQAIVCFLGSGETHGQLFFWTEVCDFDSLSTQLAQNRQFSSEDIIEIGWQVCSALQQSHNLGLAYGGLSLDSILLSDNLQVLLVDFGVARWLTAAQHSTDSATRGPALITVSALASREDVEQDLASLAEILRRLLQTTPEPRETSDTAKSSTRVPLEKLLARLTSANPALRLVSAREFQGRLGEILIGNEDDAMPLLDQREFKGGSKRSIIVELFEPTESIQHILGANSQSAGSAWRKQILPILFVVIVLVILTMIAGFLR